MLGIGVVGCGRHGQRYLRHLSAGDVPGVQPVAICRRDRPAGETLAREHGVRYWPDVTALLADPAVDAVVLTTPPGRHREELRAALDARKPVLVEKPMVTSVAAALEVVRWSGEGVPVMVAQTLRYNPTLRFARERAARLGSVHRIRLAQRLEPSALAWQRDPDLAGGGSLALTGVHLFDLLRWWVGRTPDTVTCTTRRVSGHPFENLFDACFEFTAEELLAGTEVSKFGPGRASWLDVVGTAGQLHADYGTGVVTEWGEGAPTHHEIGDRPTLPDTLLDFARVAQGEIAPPITAHDGLETLRMIKACQRAGSERRTVRLDEIAVSTASEEMP